MSQASSAQIAQRDASVKYILGVLMLSLILAAVSILVLLLATGWLGGIDKLAILLILLPMMAPIIVNRIRREDSLTLKGIGAIVTVLNVGVAHLCLSAYLETDMHLDVVIAFLNSLSPALLQELSQAYLNEHPALVVMYSAVILAAVAYTFKTETYHNVAGADKKAHAASKEAIEQTV